MTVERGHPVVHRTFGKDFMLAHWPSKIAVKWPNYVIIALQRYHEAADFITKRSFISETHGRKFRKLLRPWPELTTFAFGVRNLARNFENLNKKKIKFSIGWIIQIWYIDSKMEPNLSVPIAYLTHFNSTSGFTQELLVNTLYIFNPNAAL